MKVFISWSGQRSKHVASALYAFLPDIIQSLEPWMSSHDILAGARWSVEIGGKLNECDYGIVCLTPDNVHADWLLFEAGALAKRLEQAFLVPYLIGLEPSEVPSGPLTQFQAKRSTREDTWQIVLDINKQLGDRAIDAARLGRLFEKSWPDLDAALRAAPGLDVVAPKGRTTDDVLAEVLDTVRELAREVARLQASQSTPSLNSQLFPSFESADQPVDLEAAFRLTRRTERLHEAVSAHPVMQDAGLSVRIAALSPVEVLARVSRPPSKRTMSVRIPLPHGQGLTMPMGALVDFAVNAIRADISERYPELGGDQEGYANR